MKVDVNWLQDTYNPKITGEITHRHFTQLIDLTTRPQELWIRAADKEHHPRLSSSLGLFYSSVTHFGFSLSFFSYRRTIFSLRHTCSEIKKKSLRHRLKYLPGAATRSLGIFFWRDDLRDSFKSNLKTGAVETAKIRNAPKRSIYPHQNAIQMWRRASI